MHRQGGGYGTDIVSRLIFMFFLSFSTIATTDQFNTVSGHAKAELTRDIPEAYSAVSDCPELLLHSLQSNGRIGERANDNMETWSIPGVATAAAATKVLRATTSRPVHYRRRQKIPSRSDEGTSSADVKDGKVQLATEICAKKRWDSTLGVTTLGEVELEAGRKGFVLTKLRLPLLVIPFIILSVCVSECK